MKYLTLSRRKIEPDAYLGTFADPSHASTLISEDTTVLDETGKPVLSYIRSVEAELDLERLRRALARMKWATGYRATKTSAMKNTSKVFGYQPRLEIRNLPCRIASLALEDADIHSLLEQWTAVVGRYYRELAPVAAGHHQAETNERIKKRFHLAETMFTSGIVNKSNVLPYHYDSGNFKGAWSAMLGLKRNIGGGYLVIPEFDLALEVADGSLSFFDGQKFLHGVTPMSKRNNAAERYTIVWYSLRKMWLCLTAGEEAQLMNERMMKNARKKIK